MLRLLYTLGWLPALIGAFATTGWAGAPRVISAAGGAGAAAGGALAATLMVLTIGYAGALRRPPDVRGLAWAAAGSLAAALVMPALFSADVYAYAYYGGLALAGHNPYADGVRVAGPLAHAVFAAWDGRVPPRCVYGPVAVAIAALADLAGAAVGPAGQIAAGRLAAVAAYAAYAAGIVRLTRDPTARAACILNPTVLWSVAEGHNDAAMVAAAVAGVAATRARPLWLAVAALVKAPALALWSSLRPHAFALSLGITVIGYVPLACALLSEPGHSLEVGGAFLARVASAHASPLGLAAAWQSPLGLLAAAVGEPGAVGIALLLLGVCAVAARRLVPAERSAALSLAAWFALPNAYPWYALWIVPLAARNVSSLWSRGLLVAAAFAPARALIDAVYAAADRSDEARVFHLPMILLEFVPPLGVVAVAVLRRLSAAGATTLTAIAAAGLLAVCRPADAQSLPVSPAPAPAASASGQPQPAAAAVPAPLPPPTPTSGAAASGGVPPATPAPAAAPAPATPLPAAVSSAPPASTATSGPVALPPTPTPVASTPQPAPTAAPTANPFGYIITPQPVPAAPPDGPRILEVEVNDRHIHAGGPLMVRVITSANVVGVEARTLGRFIPIPQNSPGLFAAVYTMPDGIPFWLLNRSYQVVIAAATADGRQTSVSFEMLLTR